MALNFQPLSIVFAEGVDTKSDPKTVQPTKLLALENGVFTRPGIIAKRNGYRVLDRAIMGSASTITAAQAIAVFNDELLLFTGKRVYSWSAALSAYLDRGPVSSCVATSIPTLRNSASQSDTTVAVALGVRLVAWTDSRDGVRYSVQDTETGAFFVSDQLARAGASRPKCVAFGNELVLLYSQGASLYYRRIKAMQPSTVSAEVNPISTLSAGVWDALTVGGRLFLAWNDVGGSFVNLTYLDAAFAIATGVASVFGANGAGSGIALASDALQNVAIMGADTLRVRAASYTYALTPIVASTQVEAIPFVSRVSGVIASDSSSLNVFYECDLVSTNDPNQTRVRTCTIDVLTGTLGTPRDLMRGVGIWARPIAHNGVIYLPVARQSEFQSAYWLVDLVGQVIAKLEPGTAGGLHQASTHAFGECSLVAPGIFEVGVVSLGRFVTEGGQGYALPGAGVVRLDFGAAQRWQTAKLRNNLLIGGAVVQMYDGFALGEAGFHQYPEALLVTAGAAFTIVVTQQGTGALKEITTFTFPDGGSIAAGQYFVVWANASDEIRVGFTVDGRGVPVPTGASFEAYVSILSTDTANQVAAKVQAEMAASLAGTIVATVLGAVVTTTTVAVGAVTDASNPAAPRGVATGPAAGSYQYTAIYERTDNFGQTHRSAPAVPITRAATGKSWAVKVPTLRATGWSDVRLVVYRTKSNGTVFFRTTPISLPVANSKAVDFITITDGYTDAELAGAETLYTTGSVLEAATVPGANLLTTYKDRIFLAGQANPYVMRYSTSTLFGEAVYFPDRLAINVDQRGGPITALAALDDKLIVFKESAVFAMAGDGPTNTGQGQDFDAPSLITTDVGCTNPSSIVATPQGLMFQTSKGFYLLDRGLSVSYLGDQVEAFNASQVTGAALAPDTNQVRFCSSDAPALVYDYLAGQWSTFTNHEAVGCVVWGGAFLFARADGRVLMEAPGTWVDGDQFFSLVVETANIIPPGLQSWVRIKELRILGTYKGPHNLRVSIATSYNPTFTQIEVWDATAEMGSSVYGGTSPYGSDPVYGGVWRLYNWGIRVADAKCSAIRVRIEDTQASGYNEGMALNGLALLVGMKRGLARLPASRRG